MTDVLTNGCMLTCTLGAVPAVLPVPPGPATLAGQPVATTALTLPPGLFGVCRKSSPPPPCAPAGSWQTGGSSKMKSANAQVLTIDDSFSCTAGPGTVTATQPVTQKLNAKR